MSKQYFENNPELEHQIRNWDFTLLGNKIKFQTDSGVFSRSTVDFGSRTLIDAVDYSALTDGKILDLGCGYGPIGLSIAKAYPNKEIIMSDVNLRAIELVKKNADINNIKNIEVLESSVYDNISQKFAAILTNPPIRAGKDIVSAMVKNGVDHLLPGGSIWVVIQKKQGAPSIKKLMEEIYGNVEVVTKNKGYYILKSLSEK